MKKLFLSALLLVLSLGTEHLYAFQSADSTTILLIRHAEKVEDRSRNPSLSEAGIQRSANLYQAVKDHYTISAIYSTNYQRTLMTAQPMADSLGLEIATYGFDDIHGWLNSLVSSHNGQAILIVGHSNTTPMLTNILLGREEFEQLNEKDYGDIFIVTVSGVGDGTVKRSTF